MSLVSRLRDRLRMDPPVVLLERGFLAAVTDEHHVGHATARAVYARLVDEYEADTVLLRAVSEHLPAVGRALRAGVFAPVEPLHVAGQHRRAVDLMLEGDDVADPDLALTLVMLERHSIRRIATLDERFAAFDLEVVSAESAP